MNFKSDNVVGVCPEIMQAVMDANHGDQSATFKSEVQHLLNFVETPQVA